MLAIVVSRSMVAVLVHHTSCTPHHHHRSTDRQADQEQDEDAAAGYYVFYILKAFFGFIPKHSMPAGPVVGRDVHHANQQPSGPMKHGFVFFVLS